MSLAPAGRVTPLTGVGEGLVSTLVTCTVLVLFLISSMMLARFGIDYETPGGSPLLKIHPATYLALAALCLWLLIRLDVIAALHEIVRLHPGLALFALTWLVLAAHIVLVQRTPITMIVDTFLLPMILLVLLPRVGHRAAGVIAVAIHAVMAVNAGLGLVEFALDRRLTPLVAGGVDLVTDWRSSALLGHPLANALAAGTYLLILLLGGGRDLPRVLIVAAAALQIAALPVFGGRAALAVLVIFASLLVAGRAARILTGEAKVSLTAAAAACLLGLTIMAGAVAALASGYLERFLERFVADEGSAEARANILYLLDRLSWEALLVGPDPEHVATLQRVEGLAFGIESFWIAMVVYYGVLASVPFFVGLLAFLRDVARAASPGSGTVLVFVLIVCSTSASISGKTTILAVVVALVLVLMRRPPDRLSRSARRC